ncbi:hypothetical protein HYH03_011291 [Edaphochlamys debaryana]|uniref:Uncharacterized protein n=1 Tax=Edaphochlamys debaryana TaxID=47281 RepID=A0A836BWP8_9CHLO|nr:hypothetical protein HYH03_011291 [Edaphochlamys debaryana]|eukprot:KAG2490344.1 hypothetical protein HYH03_011291 [Edaphochlamys debaryana]
MQDPVLTILRALRTAQTQASAAVAAHCRAWLDGAHEPAQLRALAAEAERAKSRAARTRALAEAARASRDAAEAAAAVRATCPTGDTAYGRVVESAARVQALVEEVLAAAGREESLPILAVATLGATCATLQAAASGMGHRGLATAADGERLQSLLAGVRGRGQWCDTEQAAGEEATGSTSGRPIRPIEAVDDTAAVGPATEGFTQGPLPPDVCSHSAALGACDNASAPMPGCSCGALGPSPTEPMPMPKVARPPAVRPPLQPLPPPTHMAGSAGGGGKAATRVIQGAGAPPQDQPPLRPCTAAGGGAGRAAAAVKPRSKRSMTSGVGPASGAAGSIGRGLGAGSELPPRTVGHAVAWHYR